MKEKKKDSIFYLLKNKRFKKGIKAIYKRHIGCHSGVGISHSSACTRKLCKNRFTEEKKSQSERKANTKCKRKKKKKNTKEVLNNQVCKFLSKQKNNFKRKVYCELFEVNIILKSAAKNIKKRRGNFPLLKQKRNTNTPLTT